MSAHLRIEGGSNGDLEADVFDISPEEFYIEAFDVGKSTGTVAILNLAQAEQLAEVLIYFIRNHPDTTVSE